MHVLLLSSLFVWCFVVNGTPSFPTIVVVTAMCPLAHIYVCSRFCVLNPAWHFEGCMLSPPLYV